MTVKLFLFAAIFYGTTLIPTDPGSKIVLWIGFVGSIGLGIICLFLYLHPNTRFEPPRDYENMSKEEIADEFRRKQEDQGDFSYTEEGFIVKLGEGESIYAWSDIDTIFGFKLDLMTYDEICMDIFTSSKSLRLTEEKPGWYVFNQRLSENIPIVGKHWDLDVMFPAFKTNMTLLFDKQARTLAEAEVACYTGQPNG